jgi:hypothetical protein
MSDAGVWLIEQRDVLAADCRRVIREGDVAGLKRLLDERRGLGRAWLVASPTGCEGEQHRSLLHVATDWPGHFPNVARTINVLASAGADVNARFVGTHQETPLHWAASSNDIAALDALLDAGADVNADNGVIGHGTPLTDAVAFGQWGAARRLLERGARPGLWEAAALGLDDQVVAALDVDPPVSAQLVTEALWGACHGGQQATAELLLGRGADLNWVGWSGRTPLDAALDGQHTALAAWLRARGARHASGGS